MNKGGSDMERGSNDEGSKTRSDNGKMNIRGGDGEEMKPRSDDGKRSKRVVTRSGGCSIAAFPS